VVDAAMNDLIRPSLYNAYHEIVPVVRPKVLSTNKEKLDVVGPVCESGDFFARDRELPKIEEGELLAILDAGAYGMALSSNYNSRPRPA
jgi:diaminopimelate decarboxylase